MSLLLGAFVLSLVTPALGVETSTCSGELCDQQTEGIALMQITHEVRREQILEQVPRGRLDALSTASPSCDASVLSQMRSIKEGTVIISAFDENYVPQAQVFAKRVGAWGLPFVGHCSSAWCVQKFWRGCSGCSSALVIHCPSFMKRVELQVTKTTRCQGWRGIQFPKVAFLLDVLNIGKNAVMLDLDHEVPGADFIQMLEAESRESDVLIFRRDGSGLMNFGAFYARSTNATLRAFGDLNERVMTQWDQAAWNEAMEEAEAVGSFKCVVRTNMLPEALVGAFLEEDDDARCGLQGMYHPNNSRHPRCSSSPE